MLKFFVLFFKFYLATCINPIKWSDQNKFKREKKLRKQVKKIQPKLKKVFISNKNSKCYGFHETY